MALGALHAVLRYNKNLPQAQQQSRLGTGQTPERGSAHGSLHVTWA